MVGKWFPTYDTAMAAKLYPAHILRMAKCNGGKMAGKKLTRMLPLVSKNRFKYQRISGFYKRTFRIKIQLERLVGKSCILLFE